MREKALVRDVDMLQGRPISKILFFSAPLIVGNLAAQLYTATDAAIVGNFLGVDAFAAIGCTSWITWLIIAMCRDASNAICIMASVQAGAKCQKEFQRVLGAAIIGGVILSSVVTICGLITVEPILRLLHVPSNIFEQAGQYLRIFVLSIPFMMAHNLACAFLRAKGNGRGPLMAMIASAATNIILDYCFIKYFGAGIGGAAWATLLAQGIAAIVAVLHLNCRSYINISKTVWTPDFELLRKFFSLFFPMILNSAIITAGGIFVQSQINLMGSTFTAGIAAGTKVFNILEAVIMAIQAGVGVYIGQNLGAGQIKRIRFGFRETTLWTILLTIIMIVLVWLWGEPVIALFLSSESLAVYSAALETAVWHIRLMSLGLLIMTPMYFFRTATQTLGYVNYSIIAAALQLIARVATILFLPGWLGKAGYYLTDVAAWMISLPVVMVPYYQIMKKLEFGSTR